MAKTHSITSDNITYDLEDSVTPSEKPSARAHLQSFLSTHPKPPSVRELAVRINAVSTPYCLDDLTTLAANPNVDAIVVRHAHLPLRLITNMNSPFPHHRYPKSPPPPT
jgi:citrate lyase subunit beta-like protein